MSVKIKKQDHRTVIGIHVGSNATSGAQAKDKILAYGPAVAFAGMAVFEPSLRLVFGFASAFLLYSGYNYDRKTSSPFQRITLAQDSIVIEHPTIRKQTKYLIAGMTTIEKIDSETTPTFHSQNFILRHRDEKIWIGFDGTQEQAEEVFQLIKGYIDARRPQSPQPKNGGTPFNPGQPGG